MKCQSCGEVNDAAFRFCQVCGGPLGEEEVGPTVAMPTRMTGGEETIAVASEGETVRVDAPTSAVAAFRFIFKLKSIRQSLCYVTY